MNKFSVTYQIGETDSIETICTRFVQADDADRQATKQTAKLNGLVILSCAALDHVNHSLCDLSLLFAYAVILWLWFYDWDGFEVSAKCCKRFDVSVMDFIKQTKVLVADLVKIKRDRPAIFA